MATTSELRKRVTMSDNILIGMGVAMAGFILFGIADTAGGAVVALLYFVVYGYNLASRLRLEGATKKEI